METPMKPTGKTPDVFYELFDRYPRLMVCRKDILAACTAIAHAFSSGGKLLILGNGGSAADAAHIVGELMKGFRLPRAVDPAPFEAAKPGKGAALAQRLQGALPAIALTEASALCTAVANDLDADVVFAQQVQGLGKPGDVLLAISTSGNAQNAVNAVLCAAVRGMTTIALTGEGGGMLFDECDISIRVPERETFKVQELHLPVYHALCASLELLFF